MDYFQKIVIRENILGKASKGKRITEEEKEWLSTHPTYNIKYEPSQYYRVDVQNLNFTDSCLLTVELESVAYEHKIFPVISVPNLQGSIKTDFDVVDIYGNKNNKKIVKMLSVGIERDNPLCRFVYQSDLGLMAIHYECECYDQILKTHVIKSSFSMNDFAMKKEVISKNKIRYYCKSPFEENFDAMVFSVGWEPF